MIIHDCEQGSLEWLNLRLGIPTMSQADKLMTPKTRKPSGSQHKYRAELLAEWLLGQPLDAGSSQFMERGTDQEKDARKWYEFDREVKVKQVGFITTEDGLIGGSPDGLRDEDGVIEIKVLAAKNHVLHMLGDDPDYIGQCQGLLWLTDRDWVDFISYNTDLPPVVHRVERDPEWIEAFVPVVTEFSKSLEADKKRLAEHKITRPWNFVA